MKAKKTVAKKVTAPRSSLTAAVEELAEVLRRHDLSEIEVEESGRRVRVRRGGDNVVQSVAYAPAQPTGAPAQPSGGAAASSTAPAATAATTDGNVSYITSPFVGTFYRSPGPDSAAFVDVGTRFKKGQVLCIVEAMKLMNEIESEIEGSIVQCLVENGHPVEYGEPLFKIKQD